MSLRSYIAKGRRAMIMLKISKWTFKTRELESRRTVTDREVEALLAKAPEMLSLAEHELKEDSEFNRQAIRGNTIAAVARCMRMKKMFDESATTFLLAIKFMKESISAAPGSNEGLKVTSMISSMHIDAALSWMLHGDANPAEDALTHARNNLHSIDVALAEAGQVFADPRMTTALEVASARIEALRAMQAFLKDDLQSASACAKRSLEISPMGLTWLCTRKGIPEGLPGFLDDLTNARFVAKMG